MTPEIAALQHEAERAGARFQLIPGPRGLLGQVTANDEVIALADGLFATHPPLADRIRRIYGRPMPWLAAPPEAPAAAAAAPELPPLEFTPTAMPFTYSTRSGRRS